MTRRANKLFFLGGAGAVLLALAAEQLHKHTGSEIAGILVGVFPLVAFVSLVFGGVLPWAGTLILKHPMHDTAGYRDDYAAEPEKETGGYLSQGWRRRRERVMHRNIKAFGLYIEPDEKS
ncbi:hypothetical protein [Shinella zoogloeoides]|uniref:Uncharacterized protein n=1 Tax=Shinella zoogloeoides TaxID=352475 RepID=A0A6N8TBJ1_SHIZO|nr:hypothetical protein [Shinella zoogloeoides]MXN99814.1 hypothetical protein [Shinella zoogloeoides]UEX80699.1 hypothetical protein K8M09_13955 [Shinella zoogloeoides]